MGVSDSGARAAVVIMSLPCVAERGPSGWSIGLEHHPGRDGARLDQLQGVRPAALREQPEPVADDDGVDPQVELVDEVALKQPAEQLAAAMELELAAGFRL